MKILSKKTALFTNQCREKMSHLTNNKVSKFSRNWCHATMIKLLKYFTHGLARIKLDKIIEDRENTNKAKDIHKIECIIMKFN